MIHHVFPQFCKGRQICDFLFDSQYNETILGKGLLLKDRISSCGGWGDLPFCFPVQQIFLLEVDFYEDGRLNEKDRIVS